MKILRGILSIIGIILGTIIIMSHNYSKVTGIMPYMLTCVGIVQVINGIEFYKQNKKYQSILMFVFGIFIFAFVINVYIFQLKYIY